MDKNIKLALNECFWKVTRKLKLRKYSTFDNMSKKKYLIDQRKQATFPANVKKTILTENMAEFPH